MTTRPSRQPRQPVLDLGQDRLVCGVARPAPTAHRDPLPGHREPDDDLPARFVRGSRVGLLVTVTGVLELAGAAGLLWRPSVAWAAGGLSALLVAMFPANVYAALAGLTLGGASAMALLPRTLLQLVFLVSRESIGFTWRCCPAASLCWPGRVGP